MLIYSTTGPLYPITITDLHVSENDEIERSGKLFTYFYKIVVTESTRYGTEKDVVKKVYVTFSSEIVGTLKEWKIERGTVIRGPGVPIADVEEPCKHEVQFGGICTECGKDMTEVNYANSARDTDRATINMTHRNPALKVSVGEAQRVSGEVKRRLVKSKKLSLVVDLDQTIIHATVDPTVAEWRSDEENPNYEAVKDVKSFQLADEGPGVRSCWYHIKLRPGLQEFLERTAQLYELHVYTMGTRAYADQIMKLVDPERKLFGDRVLSRDESGSMSAKDLRRLFPIDDSMVVIIDDRGDVWNWDPHLVKVHGYNFFVGIGDINSSFLPKRPEELATQKGEVPVVAENPVVAEEPTQELEAAPVQEASEPAEDSTTDMVIDDDIPTNGQKDTSDSSTGLNGDIAEEPSFGTEPSTATEPSIGTEQSAGTEPSIATESSAVTEPGIGTKPSTATEPGIGTDPIAQLSAEEISGAQIELVSSLNRTLSKMVTQGDAALLQEQTHEQDEQIAAQLADRPLLQKQMQLDKIDEEAANRGSTNGNVDDNSSPRQRHNLLHDDDTELDYLGQNLARIHEVFYDEYQRNSAIPLPDGRVAQLRGEKPTKPLFNDEQQDNVPNIEILLPQMKQQVLHNVVIVFSGVIPRGVPIKDSEIAIWAASFGARIDDEVTKRTTHLVAARKGTNKIHEARRRRRIKIVTTHWLHDSLTRFDRMPEDDYLLLAPDEKTHAVVDSNTLFFDEHNDVSSTEETGADVEDDLDTTDLDDETDDFMSEATDDNKAVDISEDNWLGMQDELADFLGSEVEEESDGGESDAGADAGGDGDTPNRKKRKRSVGSGPPSDPEDSDASVSSRLGSQLQRRKKKALERTSSLTNAFTADDVGLPSPEATAAEETKETKEIKETKETKEIKEIKETKETVDIQAGDDDDDGFDEAFREALEEAE